MQLGINQRVWWPTMIMMLANFIYVQGMRICKITTKTIFSRKRFIVEQGNDFFLYSFLLKIMLRNLKTKFVNFADFLLTNCRMTNDWSHVWIIVAVNKPLWSAHSSHFIDFYPKNSRINHWRIQIKSCKMFHKKISSYFESCVLQNK